MTKSVSISKRSLWRFVNKKIKASIHNFHVFSIITILFDEMIKDIKAEKKIKIHNLGYFHLIRLRPRMYNDIISKTQMMSRGSKIIRFYISRGLNKKLRKHLDIS